jgi:predicted DNA binding CopG/RHH family protein
MELEWDEEKENRPMRKPTYSDDKGDYGSRGRRLSAAEITALGIPRPEELAARLERTVKVTVELEARSLEFLKTKAKEARVPYQRMLRELVKSYAEAAS